jgi:hypothetical protein
MQWLLCNEIDAINDITIILVSALHYHKESNNNSIKFFIYLRAELNSQWPITESA